ncbi:hypothetical protein L6R50_20175 [Myxococcota bacterium]|nr:hypothetical protein [Myxococcota bacterium]
MGADVTGDGHPDLLVGARGALSGGARTGGVYVIAGGRI